jgi:hypothetical protein
METMRIGGFGKVQTIRAGDFNSTYYGKPSNAETIPDF